MANTCSSCGATAPADAKFCAMCGRSLVDAPPASAERRPVTVLFADAVGSTAFTERRGDEAAYRFIQACIARMSAAIERHGGTITQFRGDGVMALFGAPVAQENSAVEAVTAALEIQSSLRELSDQCDFRVGLSTGPVVVGRIGDDVLLDYTAIGDTANVAARMEQSAPEGGVLIAEPTWRAVREFVECRPVGELDVKGKQAPVAAFEAVERRAIRTRLEAAVERGLGPFVGRARELELLASMVDDLGHARGGIVEIIGEAGMGKSRLLLELRNRLPDGMTWTEGRCSAGAEHIAYLPIANLLRDAFGIEEHDDPPTIATRVDDAAQSWSDAARHAVPYLKFVLDVDPGDDDVESLDPRLRRAAVVDALRIALEDAGRRQPRVVVVEDVHWADESSREALRALAESTATAGVLLITTSRTGYDSPFDGQSHHTRLALDSLAPEAAMEITADVLDAERVAPDVAALISEHAEGNPLFVEELTATLVETGLLESRDGTGELTRAVGDIDVPTTLQDVILTRIDRLAREARDALQLAAVIGREFTVRLLDRLAGLPDGLDETLEELKSVELIRQKSWFPELAYLFKHALTHEVTYSTLLDERRRDLHRLVAVAIEDVYADRIAEHVESLAHHWFVAEEWIRALHYLDLAGQRAAAAFANDAAIGFYRRARDLAVELGDFERAVDLGMRLGDVHLTTSDLTGADLAFDELAGIARRAGDDDALAWALAMRGEARCYLHDVELGEVLLREAAGLETAALGARQYAMAFLNTVLHIYGMHAESAALRPLTDELLDHGVSDERAIAGVKSVLMLKPRWEGEYARCLEALEQPAETNDMLLKQALGWEGGMVLGEVGRYDQALESLAHVIEMGDRIGELMMRVRAMNTVGWLRGDLGDHDGSVEWNERCLAFLREIDLPDEEVESNARLNLAESFMGIGRLDVAAAQLDRVQEIIAGKPIRGTWMLWRFSQRMHLLLASLDIASGRPDNVGSRIDDAESLASDSQSRKYLAKAARVRAALLHERRALDEAEAEAARAVEIATSLGHPPEQWRTQLCLASIANARGDVDVAEHHRSEADAVLAGVQVRDPALAAGVARLRGQLRPV